MAREISYRSNDRNYRAVVCFVIAVICLVVGVVSWFVSDQPDGRHPVYTFLAIAGLLSVVVFSWGFWVIINEPAIEDLVLNEDGLSYAPLNNGKRCFIPWSDMHSCWESKTGALSVQEHWVTIKLHQPVELDLQGQAMFQQSVQGLYFSINPRYWNFAKTFEMYSNISDGIYGRLFD